MVRKIEVGQVVKTVFGAARVVAISESGTVWVRMRISGRFKAVRMVDIFGPLPERKEANGAQD